MKATIYPITAAAPNRIAIVARPRGGDWLCDELSALSREGMDVLVSMLTEQESNELGLNRESEGCGAAAITFVSLPIPDRSLPPDAKAFLHSVEQLAEMVREGRFLGVHCRGSNGRSSVLAVSILVRLGGRPPKRSKPLSWPAAAGFLTHLNNGGGSFRIFPHGVDCRKISFAY